MMMKKLLFSSLFLLGSLVSQAQHEYTIEGKVEGVKDGTLVSLFLLDGNVGSTVAMDTIQKRYFLLQTKCRRRWFRQIISNVYP